jgi:WD40 repeat protein
LDVTQLEDGPVVVSGGEDGKLRRWRMADGSPFGAALDLRKGKVTSAAIGDRDGRQFIVAAYEHVCTVGLWDLEDLDTGQPMGELEWGSGFPLSERLYADARAVAAGRCDGKPVIVAGHSRGAHRWIWTGSEWVAKPLISHENIWAVALGMLGGRSVAAFGGESLLTTLDLVTGKLAAPSCESPDRFVIGVAVGEVDGRAVAVSGNFFGTDPGILRVWDLEAENEPLMGSLIGHYGGVQSLVTARLGDRPVLVSGGFDRAIGVWDLKDSLNRMADRVEHHDFEWLQACHLGAGRPAVVSKSSATVSFAKSWVWRKKVDEYRRSADGPFLISSSSTFERGDADASAQPVIRVWDLADGTPVDARPLDLDHLGDVRAVGRVGDAVLGVSMEDVGDLARSQRFGAPKWTRLKLRDLRSGEPVGRPIPITSDAGDIRHTIAVGGFGDAPVVAFCDALPGDDSPLKKNWLQVWDVDAGTLLWEPLPAYHEHGGPVVRAVGTLAGHPIAVITALLRFGIWDLGRGELIAEPPSMQREYFLHPPAAIGELAGRPVVVYGGYGRPIRIWDMTADVECERAIEVDTEIKAITIAPDSTIIAAGPSGALAMRVEATFFDPVPAPRERRTKAVDAEVRVFSVAGPADQAYLASVSSREPLDKDLEQYAELRRHLPAVIDADELRSGYDYFGRLVLWGTMAHYSGTTETLFAVGWPFLRMEYRPLWSGRDKDLDDAAIICGEASFPPGHRPVYISLRQNIDLLPAEEPLWNFGWGYDGTDPWHLRVSICRAAGFLRGTQQKTYPTFDQWLKGLVEGYSSGQPLEIPISCVRAKFQELRESSGG